MLRCHDNPKGEYELPKEQYDVDFFVILNEKVQVSGVISARV